MNNGAKTVQAVIFDLDGVLVDSEWVSFRVWRDFAERNGGKLESAVFPIMVGTSFEESAELVMRHAGIRFDMDETCAWVWHEVERRLRYEIQPMPGSAEVVRALAKRGCRLAIASNSITSYIDSALEGIGLLDCFPVRVSVDQVAQGKPAPDVYLRAAEQLGAAPSHCLAIEDSRVGVQAAASAGIRVIAVPGQHDQRSGFDRAWRVFDSMTSVKNQLESVLQQAAGD